MNPNRSSPTPLRNTPQTQILIQHNSPMWMRRVPENWDFSIRVVWKMWNELYQGVNKYDGKFNETCS